MSPKKLLRLKEAGSTLDEFDETKRFMKVYGEKYPEKLVSPDKVRKAVFCSGQVYYDLLAHREKNDIKDVAILRIEEMHPFPWNNVQREIRQYKNASIHWT